MTSLFKLDKWLWEVCQKDLRESYYDPLMLDCLQPRHLIKFSFLLLYTGANVRSRNLQGMKSVPIHLPHSSRLFILCIASALRWAKHEVMRISCKLQVYWIRTYHRCSTVTKLHLWETKEWFTWRGKCFITPARNFLIPTVKTGM